MDVKIGSRWRDVIDAAVESGRYADEREVINEGLRLVAEKEARFRQLKALIDEAYEDDTLLTPEEVRSAIDRELAEFEQAPAK